MPSLIGSFLKSYIKKPKEREEELPEAGLEEEGFFDVAKPYKKAAFDKLREQGVPEAALTAADFVVPDSPLDLIGPRGTPDTAAMRRMSDKKKVIDFKVPSKDKKAFSKLKMPPADVDTTLLDREEKREKAMSRAVDEMMAERAAQPKASVQDLVSPDLIQGKKFKPGSSGALMILQGAQEEAAQRLTKNNGSTADLEISRLQKLAKQLGLPEESAAIEKQILNHAAAVQEMNTYKSRK